MKNRNFLRNIEQEAENEFNGLITKIGIVAIFGIILYIVVVILVNEKPEVTKIEDSYTTEFKLISRDGVVTYLTIHYRFVFDLRNLDRQSEYHFKQSRELFYKDLFYHPVSQALRSKVYNLSFGTDNLFETYENLVEKTIKAKLPYNFDLIEVDYKIEHSPELLKKVKELRK